MFDADFKPQRMARGVLALEPDLAEEIVLAFIDDAMARGDHNRARLWQTVLEHVTALIPSTRH